MISMSSVFTMIFDAFCQNMSFQNTDVLVQYEICIAISPLLAVACRYGVPKAAVDVEIPGSLRATPSGDK